MLAFLNKFDNRISLEPFLTKKCNYECRHCMYSCSRKSSNDFISDDMLLQLETQVLFLKSIGFKVGINLLGGEPTLYFNKLKHVLDVISNWNVTITMPTNGWWLENKKSCDRFFDTFQNFIAPNGSSIESNNGNGLFVQISDEKYHQEWRSKDNNEHSFKQLFLEDDYDQFSPHNKHPWIMWEHLNSNYYINPQGNGRELSNAHDYIDSLGKRGSLCWAEQNNKAYPEESIHYDLDGTISSTCAFGNDRLGIGSINDNVLFIIALEKTYKEFRRNQVYNCYNCNQLFCLWKDRYLDQVSDYYQDLNTFDVNKFINTYRRINKFEYK